jgi:hypothetical protein
MMDPIKVKNQQLSEQNGFLKKLLLNVGKPITVSHVGTQTEDGELSTTVQEETSELLNDQETHYVCRQVQKIDPITFELVELYEKVKLVPHSQTNLRNAIKNHAVYKGYRWKYLEDDQEDPNQIVNLQPTVVKKEEPVHDFVAELSYDKLSVTRVFQDQQTCAQELKLSKGQMYNLISKERPYMNSNYYCRWRDVDEVIRDKYIAEFGIPYIDVETTVIEKWCAQTKQKLETYPSQAAAYNANNMSHAKLRALLNTKTSYNGFYWKKVPSVERRYAQEL